MHNVSVTRTSFVNKLTTGKSRRSLKITDANTKKLTVRAMFAKGYLDIVYSFQSTEPLARIGITVPSMLKHETLSILIELQTCGTRTPTP